MFEPLLDVLSEAMVEVVGSCRGCGTAEAINEKRKKRDGEELGCEGSSIRAIRLTVYSARLVCVYVKVAAQPLAATNAQRCSFVIRQAPTSSPA